MKRIREKFSSFQRETVELVHDMNKHRVSTGLCFLAAAVFVCWPDVNFKKSGVDAYVVNVGKCLVVVGGIITYADKARKLGI
jgi:hypothetical protein